MSLSVSAAPSFCSCPCKAGSTEWSLLSLNSQPALFLYFQKNVTHSSFHPWFLRTFPPESVTAFLNSRHDSKTCFLPKSPSVPLESSIYADTHGHLCFSLCLAPCIPSAPQALCSPFQGSFWVVPLMSLHLLYHRPSTSHTRRSLAFLVTVLSACSRISSRFSNLVRKNYVLIVCLHFWIISRRSCGSEVRSEDH